MGAPSRLEGLPPRTRARVLKKIGELATTEQFKKLQGRIEIVRSHFCELFTDTTAASLPDWIDKSWPREPLEILPTIDAERVREVTWAFRKRTSCGDDHLVIEMLRELDMDIWSKICEMFPVHIAEKLDGEK